MHFLYILSVLSVLVVKATNGNFTITTSITIQQIEVINLLGEKVYSLRYNTPTQTLHLTTLSKGVYFIRLKTADGLVMKKVVVE